jgi:hypothetical protein
MRTRELWLDEIATGAGGDAGLYDLLLHSRDRCFDVPALYSLARSAGLHLLSFAVHADAYDPLTHVSEPAVRRYLSTLDIPRRQAIAEQLVGKIVKHEFFLARRPDRGASLRDEDNALRSYGSMLVNAKRLAAEMVPAPGRTVRYADSRHTLQIPCTPLTKFIFAHMDGMTSLRSMRKRACRTLPGVTPGAFEQELARIYHQLHPLGYLYLLRAGSYGVSVPDYARLGRR